MRDPFTFMCILEIQTAQPSKNRIVNKFCLQMAVQWMTYCLVMLSFPVKYRASTRQVECVFANGADIQAVRSWTAPAYLRNKPRIRDALEFSQLAVNKWRYYKRKGCVASDMDEIHEYITDNPYNEVAICGVARAPWYKHGPILGVCFFRRTWCNNLIVDYLTTHPLTKMAGISGGCGSALLYFIATVADGVGPKHFWGEATQNSAKFYECTLGLRHTTDLILASAHNLTQFKNQMKLKIEKAVA